MTIFLEFFSGFFILCEASVISVPLWLFFPRKCRKILDRRPLEVAL